MTTDPVTPAPTQTVHPWRATVRTVLAALPLLPIIAVALGVDTVPWVAAAIGFVAGITRVIAIPEVNAWLTSLGLGATPKS
jgi:hypothetical protein